MKRALQHAFHRVHSRIGQAGLGGLALLAVALVATIMVPHFQHEADALRAALAAKADALNRPAPTVRRPPSAGEQLQEYVSGFPLLSQNASDLERVFDAARRRSVSLDRGEYQLKSDPNSALVTYTATFPIREDYGTLKRFTADVLSAMPHVSLDEMRMARTDAGSVLLDSVVRFTFVYRRQ